MYKNINCKKNYDKLLRSGMFWEFHPELSGEWIKDKAKILPNENSCKNCDNDFLKFDPQRGEKVCLKCYAVHDWDGLLMK